MKIYLVGHKASPLADKDGELLDGMREAARATPNVALVNDPANADLIVLNEAFSFKEQRSVRRFIEDPIAGLYPHKTYTINFDDCATGVLRGLYSSIPRSRFDPQLYAAIPYFTFHNRCVFEAERAWNAPAYLASWRGNDASHVIRKRLLETYCHHPRFRLESTASWYNHTEEEKARYVQVLTDAKFSLCPAGLAPVSFRIFESMILGRAPVLIADEYVYPQGPDWAQFSLALPEKYVEQLETLLSQHEPVAEEMGRRAHDAWQRYFSRERICAYYLNALLRVSTTAPKRSRVDELRRWKTWRLWRANGWTLPQRAFRRLRRAARVRFRQTPVLAR